MSDTVYSCVQAREMWWNGWRLSDIAAQLGNSKSFTTR
ncbi:MAG: hypothetical protein H7Z40_13245 [Phycisphaerae bacterium]|nr:hypothetical protein [Gemmatimonadaceae bacterium]